MKTLTILFFLFASWAQIYATEYFVSSINGNDSNAGTSSSLPWKSIAKVESKKFQPGDIVNFERGSTWSKAAWEYIFLIKDSGTATNPITFRAYGNGEKPTFSNGGQVWNKGIKITADYVIIEDLQLINTGYGGFELSKGADFNIIKKCEVSNCGMGILCYGSNNLFTENYIHDLKMIVDNEIPDTQNGGGDFGCVSFWLYGPKNEVSYNRSVNNRGHSYDYQYDGGFLEFYENCDSTYAHHNWVENGCGIMEASNGHADNVVVSYNVFIEHLGMFAPHYTLKNFRFENNTCITCEGTTWNDMFMNPTGMVIRNNIFVFGGKSSERIATNNNFTHTNNLYYLLDGAKLGSLVLSTGEKLGNPMFVDEANKDFKLKNGSPAIDAGIDLGHKTDYDGKDLFSGTAPDMGAFEYENITGIGMFNHNIDKVFFEVFPNPANQDVNVKVKVVEGQKIEINLLNLQGLLISSNSFLAGASGLNSFKFPVHGFSNGIYLVRMKNGDESVVKSFIKK